MDVSLVIVSYNVREPLRACLASAALAVAESGLQAETIVVDNASTDGSAAMVEAEFGGVTLLRSAVNEGYGAACNRGAGASGGKILVFLNADVELAGGALRELVAALRADAGAGLAGPALVDSAGGPQRSVRRFPSPHGWLLDGTLFERWRARTGLTILDGIGTTEILHIFIGNRPDDAKPGASGKLVPGYEARIVDDNDQPVATGEIGNLLIKGDSVTSRYWNQPERTAAAITDGWIRTGDSYAIDAEGYFTCQGRSDDMLKVGGIWVSPVEIEARLVSHDAVLEAAVIGRPDDEELIKPEAFIILKNSDDASDELAEALKTFCQEELARYKYPRWVHFVDELPKTATGKIQRFKLRG